MTDIRTAALQEPIDVAKYLFTRLHQLGIRSLHGVPGDYNLVALDYLPQAGISWVGNANELNAGYAADGYARVNGMGALLTTFGVGELSAVNALAGCYSEYVPVVHIVGTPSTLSQKDKMLLHHTLGNGNFSVFLNMSRDISVVTENLVDPAAVTDQIDHALRECYIQSRPVYIALPTDMVKKKVEGARLKTAIDLKYPANDPTTEDYVVDVVLKSLQASKKPTILVDACAIRHRALTETHEFITKSGLPTFVAPMGKGAVDETLPNFAGVYAGDGSKDYVKAAVNESDLVISIGAIKSDFNTAGFTYRTSALNTIEFHSTHIKVGYSEYPNVRMNGVLHKVCQQLDSVKLNVTTVPNMSNAIPSEEKAASGSAPITHAWLWPRLGQWLKPDDIVITETGTANFGIWDTRFPKGVTALSQVLWGSIGWSVGSCQGAALAAKEAGNTRRTLLFVGDGSLQLTVQEISTMIRRRLRPIIFVICNSGYTIERMIHGMDAEYNDIQEWEHRDLLRVFGLGNASASQPGLNSGSDSNPPCTYKVTTRDELDRLFADPDFSSSHPADSSSTQGEPCIQLVELHMPREDAPTALKLVADASAKNNAKE